MTVVTNEDILQNNNYARIFGHGPGHEDLSIFTDRKESKKMLLDFIHANKNKRKVAVISAHWGTGKSFLVDKILHEINLDGPSYRPIVMDRDMKYDHLTTQMSMGFVGVDDVDSRKEYRTLQEKLKVVRRFVAENSVPVVLIGDYFLRNEPHCLKQITTDNVFESISLEPVTRDSFEEYVRMKVRKFTNKELDKGDSIFDSDFLDCLLPSTAKDVVTFREILNICQLACRELKLDQKKCTISGKEYHAYSVTHPVYLATQRQKEFFNGVCDAVRRTQSKPIPELTVEEAMEFSGTHVADMRKFQTEILMPFSQQGAGLLKSFGIPYLDGQDFTTGRYGAPYLPTSKMFMEAHYGANSGSP